MPSSSRLRCLSFVLALLIVSPLVLAEDAPLQEEKSQADRVYVMNGVTISWDLDRKQMREPTAQQAAQLAEQFRAWMEAKMGSDAGLPLATEVEVETLPNGVKRARLPAYLMNAVLVRVDDDGHLVEQCTPHLSPFGGASEKASDAEEKR